MISSQSPLSAKEGGAAPEAFGFLILPEFSMLALMSALEPLRVANRLSGRQLYTWHTFTENGAPAVSSNGMSVMPEAEISSIARFPTVFVCASFAPETYSSKKTLNWLRKLARQGSCLGGIDTGAYVLASAGLLSGRKAALHWENMPSFAENFPEIELSRELFVIDDNRMTCSGGTASMDLMAHIIEKSHGQKLAHGVLLQLLHDRVRDNCDLQKAATQRRSSLQHPKLIKVLELMENNLEDPLSLEALSKSCGISRRQLERLFRTHLDDTPSGFYLKMRLIRAKQLLEQTRMSILDISLACGFVSAPYFSRAYRNTFGCTPRDARRAFQFSGRRTGWIHEELDGLGSSDGGGL